jgi:hypothetical protein
VTLDEVIALLTEECKRRRWSYRDVERSCPSPGLSHVAVRSYEIHQHEPKVLHLSTWAAALGYELELDLKRKQREEAGVTRYRKKPVEVEARQWGLGDGYRHIGSVIDWILLGEGSARYHDEDEALYIDTLEGTMRAERGDWIIKGVKGEFYPCKPDIFEATYEAVASE